MNAIAAEEFFSTPEASAFLAALGRPRCSVRSLENWRSKPVGAPSEHGPAWSRDEHGKIWYHRDDLIAWVDRWRAGLAQRRVTVPQQFARLGT